MIEPRTLEALDDCGIEVAQLRVAPYNPRGMTRWDGAIGLTRALRRAC